MLTMVEQIEALPPEDRYPAAMQLLRDITMNQDRVTDLSIRYGITRKSARVLDYLISRKGHICTNDQILTACWDNYDEREMINVNVQIHHLRKGFPKGTVRNVWGEGYIIDKDTAEEILKGL